jgi:outer membrane protein assembly factor BamE (lipoprotein component of BamABCDE complex)
VTEDPDAARRRIGCSRSLLWTAIVVATLLCIVIVVADRAWCNWNQPFYGKVTAITVGMTKAEVLQQLGAPTSLYRAGSAPENYYVEGYTFRRRPISGEVMIYLGGADMVAYIYIDKKGKVVDKFIGGS